MSTLPTAVRQHLVALRALLILTVVLGVAYPVLVTVVGQLAFHRQANGSPVSRDGTVVGSSLLGQSFADAAGNPLPQWFQPRPSSASDPSKDAGPGYDPRFSGASNKGPTNPDLITLISARRASVAAFDGVPPADVPADAVTAGASGLDPHISLAYAFEQVNRVAAARHLAAATVRALVERHVQGRTLGFLGEPRVNVLELNLELDRSTGQGR